MNDKVRRKFRNKKIALVISNLEFGGAQRQVVELANGLISAGIDCHVMSLSEYVPLGTELTQPNSLHIVRKNSRFDWRTVPKLAKLLRELHIDIVHCFLFDAEITARLAGWLADVSAVIGSERNTDYELKPVQKLAYKLTKRLQHLCIANSESGAAFNANLLGYTQAHYRVVHNAVNTERFKPADKYRAREALGIDKQFTWIGIFGSFKRQKNQIVFFQAAAQLLLKTDNVRFLVIGDQLAGGLHGSDDYKTVMLGVIADLGISPYCFFLGNRNDVENIYPACDMTALPSLFEGTPNVALESMACAVPVIASDISDNAIIIPHDQAGLIVPVNDVTALSDGMAKLMRDARAAEFGRKACAWVGSRFTIRALVDNTLLAYASAIDDQPSRPSSKVPATHSDSSNRDLRH